MYYLGNKTFPGRCIKRNMKMTIQLHQTDQFKFITRKGKHCHTRW